MRLSGLHLLLTYQCTFECDHCFVWGSPFQNGVMSLETIREILRQAKELGTVESIYFEGGEPFLYYVLMLKGIQEAVEMGFSTGIVTNSYWATGVEDAIAWLKPFVGLIQDLSVSSDLYHYSELLSQQAQNARTAAESLGIPVGYIAVAQPQQVEGQISETVQGQLPIGTSGVMYRGRAAEKLADKVSGIHWESFTSCPHENLADPGRVHVDPLGNLHLCQGLLLGNMFQKPLIKICDDYLTAQDPIVGPLLAGGPAELVRKYNLSLREAYADACLLCYRARQALRKDFPNILGPDQVYGIY